MRDREVLPKIQKSIVLPVSINVVWKAVSTSEGIAAWWMPNTLKPVVGNEFILHTGQFGDSPCKVTELDEPNHFGFDWGKDWHISFELKKLHDEETELIFIHSGWDAKKVTEFGQPHPAIYEFIAGGWEKIINEKLPAYLAV